MTAVSKRGRWPRESVEERFRSRFIPEPNSGCWLWEGKVNPFGYGVLQKNGGGYLFAHRVSAELAGLLTIPGGIVCHRCDNRSCVNPEHLFVGTHADNSRDMVLKGRSTRGERNPNARLTSEAARTILADTTTTVAEFARRYGVSRTAVASCRQRLTWRHI